MQLHEISSNLQAECLAADGVEVGEALERVECGYGVVVAGERGVEFLLQLELRFLVLREVVCECA